MASNVTPDAHICTFDVYRWDRFDDSVKIRDRTTHKVSKDTNIMVASAALTILSLATNGRMTQRIRRMMIDQRRHPPARFDSFKGIDYYGDIQDGREEMPLDTPGFTSIMWLHGGSEEVMELEELCDSEIIREQIIWEGQYWIWMGPDRYACRRAVNEI
jgi:hypothetical protein